MQVYLLQAADIIQITWIWFITDIYRVSSPENNLQGIICHFQSGTHFLLTYRIRFGCSFPVREKTTTIFKYNGEVFSINIFHKHSKKIYNENETMILVFSHPKLYGSEFYPVRTAMTQQACYERRRQSILSC